MLGVRSLQGHVGLVVFGWMVGVTFFGSGISLVQDLTRGLGGLGGQVMPACGWFNFCTALPSSRAA